MKFCSFVYRDNEKLNKIYSIDDFFLTPLWRHLGELFISEGTHLRFSRKLRGTGVREDFANRILFDRPVLWRSLKMAEKGEYDENSFSTLRQVTPM